MHGRGERGEDRAREEGLGSLTQRPRDLRFDGPADAPWTFLLAHGAGAPMDSPFLDGLAAALATAGLRVGRFEFPYMAARREGSRRPPDRELVLRQTWHDVVADLAAVMPRSRLAIGGKSMGGRIASLVADELQVGALVCLGYPFHPPKAKARLRVAHLEGLRTRTLIVQGERDAFGGREDVAGYALSPAIRIEWCPDGDHSWKPRRASGHTEASNLAFAVARIVGFLDLLRA